MTRVNSVLLPAAVVLVSVVGLLLLAGTNPWEPIKIIIEGSIGWPPFEEGVARKVGDTFMVWVPIALASAGLIVTFNAGMWNIGIEGQIIMGAITAAWVAREVSASRPILIVLTVLAGAVGGLLWGLLVGVLRTAGGVNEIFGGLGLDFVALSHSRRTSSLARGPAPALLLPAAPIRSRRPPSCPRLPDRNCLRWRSVLRSSPWSECGFSSGARCMGSGSRPLAAIGRARF